jgi:hypothetical protein
MSANMLLLSQVILRLSTTGGKKCRWARLDQPGFFSGRAISYGYFVQDIASIFHCLRRNFECIGYDGSEFSLA